MEYNLKRPKRIGEEDEDDLLVFQEQFLKNKSEKPAAKVIKINPVSSERDDISSKQQQKASVKQKIQIDCKLIISRIHFFCCWKY